VRTNPLEPAARAARVWVVAADAARARIFRAQRRDGALTEVDDLRNPVAGRGERALRADRQGHASNATHGGGHSLQRNASGPQQETVTFARRVARRLADGRRHGEIDRIYLVAEPRMLGAVRGCLDRPTRRLVAGEIDKDLTRQRPTAIRQRLPARL